MDKTPRGRTGRNDVIDRRALGWGLIRWLVGWLGVTSFNVGFAASFVRGILLVSSGYCFAFVLLRPLPRPTFLLSHAQKSMFVCEEWTDYRSCFPLR